MVSQSFTVVFVNVLHPPATYPAQLDADDEFLRGQCISIIDPEPDLAVQPPDPVLQPSFATVYNVRFTYPLTTPHVTVLRLRDNETMNRVQLARFIIAEYHKIYRIDRQTGEYGIWGHEIEDLVIEEVDVSLGSEGEGMIELSIGS